MVKNKSPTKTDRQDEEQLFLEYSDVESESDSAPEEVTLQDEEKKSHQIVLTQTKGKMVKKTSPTKVDQDEEQRFLEYSDGGSESDSVPDEVMLQGEEEKSHLTTQTKRKMVNKASPTKADQDEKRVLEYSDVGSESDSAPEEVTFQDEEEKSRQSQQHAAQQIKAQKEVLKRKRNEIHQRNKEQKEEKRKRLEEKRLPDEVLENLSAHSSETVHETSVKPVRKVFDDTKGDSSDEDVEPAKDFISIHGPTIFKLKVLNEKTKKSSIPESVANFKRNALQRVRREPTRNLIAKLEKQKVGQKNIYK